jgi:hypothetical protein
MGQATAPACWAEIGDIRRLTDAEKLVALAVVGPHRLESGSPGWPSEDEQTAPIVSPPGCGVSHILGQN